MKKKLSILTVLLLAISCSNDTSTNSTDNAKTEFSQSKLKEELPPLKTFKANMGKLKMHDNGYSIGKKTELTELRKQLKSKDCDILKLLGFGTAHQNMMTCQ